MRNWPVMQKTGGAILFAALVALTGCGGGGNSTTPTGTVNVSFTDAPSSDFDKVWVTVKAIRFHTSDTATADAGGWLTFQLPQPVTLDLAALNNGAMSSIFSSLSLPEGRYQQIRLMLAGPFDTLTASASGQSLTWNDEVDYTDGTGSHQAPLEVARPEKGIVLHGQFQVAASTPLHLAVDFNLDDDILKFVRGTTTAFTLAPQLHYYDLDNAGAITGQLDTTALYPTNASGAWNVIIKAEDVTQDGSRHYMVRATSLKPDGSFRLYPLPIPVGQSTRNLDVVIRGRNMETLIVKGVQVTRSSDGTTNAAVVQSTPLAIPLGTEYTTNVSPAASPTGGLVNFFQTLSSDPAPYEIRIHPLNPFTGTFSDDFALSTGNLHTGNWSSGGAITFTSEAPVEGTGNFTAVNSALLYSSSTRTVTQGTSPVTINFGALSVNSALATSDSISGSVTQALAGHYDRGFLVVSRDGMITTTLDLTTTLALNGGAGGAYSIAALPGGSVAFPRPGLVYYLYAVVWNSSAPALSYRVVPVTTAADLSTGNASGINLGL